MRFQQQDLKNIQANNAAMVDPLLENLIQMLTEWVERVHKYVSPPTVGNLDRALNSITVGLGALACELGKFTTADRQSHALPYLVINVHVTQTGGCIGATALYPIKAEENGSILLEILTRIKNK